MFSFAFATASTYFHLPIDEQEDADIESYQRRFLTWVAEPSPSPLSSQSPSSPTNPSHLEAEVDRMDILDEILLTDNLYEILGVSKHAALDRLALRRAYLSRSKRCHPDKFRDNPAATRAFQKVAVAYDILSEPSSKRMYDNSPSSENYDVFAARSSSRAEETFHSVIIGVLNDFLDGDLEVIRTLLRAINEINPSIKLEEEGINSVLATLHVVRERALTCRTCIHALHAEFTRLLEVQHAFRKLSYFDILGRSKLAIQLTRITLSLPIALERALGEQSMNRAFEGGYATDSSKSSPKRDDDHQAIIFPRQITLFIRGVDVILDRMERILK